MSVEQLPGGSLRFNHAAPSVETASALPPGDAGRTDQGSISYTQGAAQVEGRGLSKFMYGQDTPQATSVMTSKRRENGQLTVELEPGNPASRTHIATAARLGLVSEVAPGVWIDAGSGGPWSQPAAPYAAPQGDQFAPDPATLADPGEGGFLPGEDAAFAGLIEPLSQGSFDAALARGAAVAVESADAGALARVAVELAKAEGLEPADAEAVVAQAHAHYQRVVDRAMDAAGIPQGQLPEFYNWLRTSEPAAMRNAIDRVLHSRDLSWFKRLATEWQMRRARRG